MEKNVFFELGRKVKTPKQSLKFQKFCFWKKNVLSTFSELPSISLFLYYLKMHCSISSLTLKTGKLERLSPASVFSVALPNMGYVSGSVIFQHR
jgi:hypothetical protein